MSASHSSIQTFLEMASPLLLSGPVDTGSRDELLELARRSGLDEREMLGVVRDLQRQGIVTVDDSFLESQEQAQDKRQDQERQRQEQQHPGRQSGDSVSPPAPPARPAPPPPLDAEPPATPAEPQPIEFMEAPAEAGIEFLDAGGPAPPSAAEPPPPPPVQDPRYRALERRAAELIAIHRGVDSRCRKLLMAEASAQGLPAAAADAVLASLSGAAPPAASGEGGPSPPPLPDDAAAAGTASAAGARPGRQPASPPDAGQSTASTETRRFDASCSDTVAAPRGRRTPRESYLRYVRKAIPQLRREHISVRSEQKLVREGREKLDLGEPFALELLREVAGELDTPMLSQQSLDGDPRFDDFRQRAQPVIAEQRGVNARSRILLSHIGQELGLSEEELDQAILQLSGGVESSLDDAKRDSFRRRIDDALMRLPDRVITAPLAEELTTAGAEREGLEPAAARSVLRDAAAAAGVAVVDRAQAERHVAALLREGPADLQQVADEARLWGLGEHDFRRLVDEQRDERNRQRLREKRFTAIALGASCGAAAALIGLAAWLWWPDREPSPDRVDVTPSRPAVAKAAAAKGEDEPEPPEIAGPWLDDELQIVVTHARLLMPEQRDVLQQTLAEDGERRLRAILQLAADFPQLSRERQVGDSLSSVMTQWYRAETDEASAQQLMNELLGAIPARGAPPPDGVERYEQAFRVLEVAVSALAQPRLSKQRADWLAGRLEEKLGAMVDASRSWSELQQLCSAELAALLYRNLVDVAGRDAGPLEPHHAMLSDLMSSLLEDQRRRDALQLEFLAAVLVADKEPWEPYELLIRRFIRADEPPVLLRLAGVLERTSDERLQGLLGQLLLRRIRQPVEDQSPAEVADLVRAELGGAEAARQSRGEDVLRGSGDFLRRVDRDADEPQQLAQQMVDAARWSTIACAAQIGEPAAAVYDELQSGGSPRPIYASGPGGGRRPDRRAPSRSTDQVAQQIQLLSRTRNTAARVRIFQQVAQSIAAYGDPKQVYAAALARYLVQPKSPEEHGQMLTAAANLNAAPQVMLALVDELQRFDSREQQIEELVEAIAGPLPTEDGPGWQPALQGRLLRLAWSHLDGAAAAAGSGPVAQASEHLVRFYWTQASLRGVPETELAAANSVAGVLEMMISHAARQLPQGEVADGRDRQLLQDVAHHLAAVESAAENDLQRTVLLQRVWLRVLRIEVALRGDAAAAPARQIEDRLAALDRKSTSVLQQARDGELQLLEMWRLCHREMPG